MMPEVLTESIKNADAIVSSMKRLNKKNKQDYCQANVCKITLL